MDVPRLRSDDREQFELTLEAWRSGRSSMEPPPWVIARALKKGHPGVRSEGLAVEVYAVQLYSRGQPWLIRGYLKSTSARGLSLTRVAFEHFEDTKVEVTELRDRLQLGRIRSQALARLRAQIVDRERLAVAGHRWLEPTAEETEQLRKLAKQLSRRKAKPSGRGRVGFDAEHWRLLALDYLERHARGQKDVPSEIAKAKHLSTDTVRTELRTRCVALGFLVSRGRGRPYEAGPKLTEQPAAPPASRAAAHRRTPRKPPKKGGDDDA